MDELQLDMKKLLVSSEKNKADKLTRVKKSWLSVVEDSDEITTALDIMKNHKEHHMGVESTLYTIRKFDPSVERKDVVQVVRECE